MNNNSPWMVKTYILPKILIDVCFILFILTFVKDIFAWQNNDKSFTLGINNNQIKINLAQPQILSAGQYDRVIINGLPNTGKAREPYLPTKTVRFLVPYGKDFEQVNIIFDKKKIIPGNFYIEPTPESIPLSYVGPLSLTIPNAQIYSQNSPYPAKPYSVLTTQSLRGYKILILNIYPIEYVPASGQLSYYENLDLELKLSPTLDTETNPFLRNLAKDVERVKLFVDNPEVISSYPAVSSINPLQTYQYLIITSDALKNSTGTYRFQDLEAQKQSKGITTHIITMEEIIDTYNGLRPDGDTDNQTRVRNCIIDYYTNHGTEYVLLGGDADGGGAAIGGEHEASPIVPCRGLYGQVVSRTTYTDSDIPADLYYACLDGTFDFDSDGMYGEDTDGPSGGEVDLLAEVYVGRAPVDTTVELSNFVHKTISYENVNHAYLSKALFAAENLDWYTWGKDYMEEIRLGSSAHGYSTVGFSGSGFFTSSTLYDYDYDSNPSHYPSYNSGWPKLHLINKFNEPIHVFNHNGHASNSSIAGYKNFTNSDADNLTNTQYFFGYTQGCYSGAFDNRGETSSTYYDYDCNIEHFLTSAHGAFSFVGNSRYGWYYVGSTSGASQRIQREFWDTIFREGIVNLGITLQNAKEDIIGIIYSSGAFRWCYFDTNLLGDPETSLQASLLSPNNFTASPIAVANASWIVLSWKNSSRTSLRGTLIRYRTDGIFPVDKDDGTLLCNIGVSPDSTSYYNHTNVTTGQTYHYTAFGYDDVGTYSDVIANTQTSALAFGLGGSGSKSSNCFIATACYSDENAPQVKILRKFRDDYLVKSVVGKIAINIYYFCSPPIAFIIRQRPSLKYVVKNCLNMIVQQLGQYMEVNE